MPSEKGRKRGYHLAEIPKGKLGEFSKIREEFLECEDALDQGAQVMLLVELSDLLGAVRAYLHKHHPGIRLKDLKRMNNLTKRAFACGERKKKKEKDDEHDRDILSRH